MSDYFGDRQNRVLSVKDRSLDNIIFQHRTPPLTSEWNLINQISNEKISDFIKSTYASGWLSSERIDNYVSGGKFLPGQVLCSIDFQPNTFRLISKDKNIALINGWPILVQGTDTLEESNVIKLNDPSGQRYDFVYLEVWRKLIKENDALYKYGNTKSTSFNDNELVWDAVGTETTKRIQVQYRIRSEKIFSTISDPNSEIFGDFNIEARAGRFENSSRRYYKSDLPGLYIAGDGSESSKSSLNTVDGYSYAIPMFLVSRRNQDEFSFNSINNNNVTKEEWLDESVRSDRPDGKLVNVIYRDDIIDLRNKVMSSSSDLSGVLQKSISKIISGDLNNAVSYGRGVSGPDANISSGGNTILKVEKISGGSDSIPSIGLGSKKSSNDFKRRSYSTSEVIHANNVIEIERNGGSWEAGDIDISDTFDSTVGGIVKADGFYSPDKDGGSTIGGVAYDNGTVSIGVGTVSIGVDSDILGTQSRLFMQYTYKYSASSKGLRDIPKEFVEINKNNLPIATSNKKIFLRYNNEGELLKFGGTNPNNGDTSEKDYIVYNGSVSTESHLFGHDLKIYRKSNEFNKIVIELNDSKLNGYFVLGIKSVQLLDDDGGYLDYEFKRDLSNSLEDYAVERYEITLKNNEGQDLKNTDVVISCITGSKPPKEKDIYDKKDSIKFLETTKQGRGVTDIVEMIEVIAVSNGDSTYTIDTSDKPIISIGTYLRNTGSMNYEVYPFGYMESGVIVNIDPDINSILPIQSHGHYNDSKKLFPTKITFNLSEDVGDIRVPVFVQSYIEENEDPYYILYKTNPYQGLLTGSENIRGKVLCEGPAIVTSLGSGAIKDVSYNVGEIVLEDSSRQVFGQCDSSHNEPLWSMFVSPGDYLRVEEDELDSSKSRLYRIGEVISDSEIRLSERYSGTGGIYNYEIIKKDVSVSIFSNVVDRLPSYEDSGYKFYSDNLKFKGEEGLCLFTSPITKEQDPLRSNTGDYVLGNLSLSFKGRNDFRLSEDHKGNSVGHNRPYLRYGKVYDLPKNHKVKVYQTYLFTDLDSDHKPTGKIYMMIISGETLSDDLMLNPFSDKDTVDIFKLDGNPIINNI